MSDDKFPLGKENYCAECYMDSDKVLLKTECPHAPVEPEPEHKMTAADIIADERVLFMNSPVGYPFADQATQREEGRLKSFLINIFAGDEAYAQAIREASLEDVIQTLLDNNMTFDPEWYGVRDIPLGRDGKPMSRLDDPEYQRKMGFRNNVVG